MGFTFNELNLPHEVATNPYASPADTLFSYEQFLQSFDPEREYAGMFRMYGPDDMVLWTTHQGEEMAKGEDRLGL